MRAVNLVPAQRHTSISLSGLKSIRPGHVVAIVLAGFAVMAVAYGTARTHTATYEAEASSVASQVAVVKRAIAAESTKATAITTSEQRVGNAAKVADARFGWAPLFHQLARRVPKGVEFTALSVALTKPGATTAETLKLPEPGTAVGADMVLTGCATAQRKVASLMRALRTVPNVSEVTLQSSTAPVAGSTNTGGGSSGGCPKTGPSFNLTVLMGPAPEVARTVKEAFLSSLARRSRKGAK